MIEVGATIAGKYRVERILGRGGMGYVVQAFHEQLAESVAIKFMVPELACDPDAVARFLREARAAFRIRSEHVARVLDVGEHVGAPFIVMELLTGHDLSTEIAERFVPSSDAVGYMLQICEALAAAHSLGIVHRDLKPSNLFLTRRSDGTPLIKVLDFGISKALDDPNLAPADSLTLSHRLLGSPHYMSPEQARAPKSADARSDIWSLGVVLYELVLCERPFRGDTAVAILASLLNDTVPEVSAEQRRKMPDELMQVIRRCLNRDPDQRFANVSEFARALLPMATASSEQLVVRIESMARAAPVVVDTPPEESPLVVRHTHGSTLVSARSSQVGVTSGTHSLDPHGLPVSRRTYGAKALTLLAVIGALFYWFAVRGVGAHHDINAAASAQSDRLQKPSESGRAKPSNSANSADNADHNQLPPNPAPTASVEVGPVAAPLETKPAASAHPERTSERTPPRKTTTGATGAPSAAAKFGAIPAGPPRPSSTADPKNRPE